MIADVVVAAVSGDVLREALPAIHRDGLGHTARVMRAERGDLRAQLRRAGIPVESGPERLAAEDLLLTVAAAGRSPVAARLLLGAGARATWIVSPSGAWRQVDDEMLSSISGLAPHVVGPIPPPSAAPNLQERVSAPPTVDETRPPA
ncbi:MAG: hypothetical protein M3121_03765 [Chloroflexota bacterium]|nr:hypothetical protein [Chloroflexota bacterium]